MTAAEALKAAALAYAKRGFAVFPCHWPDRGRCSCRNPKCHSPAKHPLTEHGLKDATPNLDQINTWWTRWPDANVAIATGAISGIVVLDVDPRHCGDETLAALEAGHDKLPNAPTVLTGGGGLHQYFKHPGDMIHNSAGTALGPGLDIRGDGGYIIAPPSIHPSGNEYLWEVSSRIGEVPLPELPAWLLELLTRHRPSCKSVERFDAPAAFEDGTRNDYLYRFARSQHARHKLTYNELLPLLIAVNQQRCKPPLDAAEVEKIAGNSAGQPDRPDFQTPSPEMQAVATLMTLDPIARAKEKKALAKRLGVPQKAIDEALAACQRNSAPNQAERLAPPAPEPCPEPVEAGGLLDDLCDFIKRFVILDEHALNAITLWIAFAHCFAVAETSPRLRITSPEKRCGKSRLLETLNVLCPRPLSASNISPSAVFRVIELEHCTLLIDEADSFLRDNEDMRNLINSGHTPEFAFVIRSVPVGDKAWEPKRFSTWCPMVIAGIGKLADTVEDRSIRIAMRRKLRGDKVERLTRRNKGVREEASALASKLARFAADSLEKLGGAQPLIPDALNDRAADNWEHLLAIADLAGGHWPTRAGAAALALSGSREDADEDSLRARLLADIQHILERCKEAEISSADLCKALVDIETAPWSELNRGKPMTPARLSRMLKDFEIYVRKVHGGKARGYRKSDFADAFERYLSSAPPDQSVQVSETLGREGASAFSEVSEMDIADTLKREETHTQRGTSDTLTLSKPRIGSKDEALQPRCSERERYEL